MPALVSVIIPVHNGERHVEQGVRSALSQTYGNLEVIVVDDGSTDGTRAVLERIVDDRLHVVHQANARVAAAYNRGVEVASGSVLALLAQRGERVELLPQVLGRTRVHPGATSARRFFPMQDALRFLVARTEARRAGGDLDVDEFRRAHRTSLRCRVPDRGHYCYRNAGMYFDVGDRRNAAPYLAGALALTPLYTVRRLHRQRSRQP